jgi:predicted O-methyltransferase YrrM
MENKRLNDLIKYVELATVVTDFNLPDMVYNMHGLTSPTSQTFLNQLCDGYPKNVLELGCYCGASSVAMSYGNKINLTVVDNWSEIEDKPADDSINFKHIENPRDEFLKNTALFNIDIIEDDIFDVETNMQLINRDFDIIFYDGPHNIEMILGFMLLYSPLFKNETVLVIDDYNFPSVQMGVEMAFDEIGHDIIKYKKEILTDGESKETFWNGLGIFIF